MTIHVEQSAEQIAPRQWKWSVWLEGPGDELDAIQSVTYQLHSSFKNPIREISNRQSGFRLDGSGWGQFMIFMTLLHRDGSEEKRQHWLRFGPEAPSKELEARFGREFRDRPPTAFLSYSVTDTVAAMAVRKTLEAKGVSVLDASSLGPGENLSDGIENMINLSDFGISIISDISSEWVNQETQQMRKRKLPVLQINADSAPESLNVNLKIQPLGEQSATNFATLIDSPVDLGKIRQY
jgi:hypothetical protein